MENLDLLVLRDLRDWRRAGLRALLVTVVRSWGSSPLPVGSILALSESGRMTGSVSGGCLEGDLREHANAVRDTGVPKVVSYDLRGPDDLLWGLGVGCEGSMNILRIRCAYVVGHDPVAPLRYAAA